MTHLSFMSLAALLLAAGGCKEKSNAQSGDATTTGTATATDTAAPEPSPAEKAAAQSKRNAQRIESAKQAAKDLQDRLTPSDMAAIKKMSASNFKTTAAAMKQILASPHRDPENRKRDVYRHPAETLDFCQIKPTDTVIEWGFGKGWYTEILAPLLVASGKLIMPTQAEDTPLDQPGGSAGKIRRIFLDALPDIYGKVELVALGPAPKFELPSSLDGTADAVLLTRELHGWVRFKSFDDNLKAAIRVLKPGGRLCVVQHRAPEGAKPEESAEKGYLAQAWVTQQMTSAGLELVGASEINANPKDTKDYEEGVWTLPPVLGLGDTDKAKYEAIGESDRMTLLFKKPAK